MKNNKQLTCFCLQELNLEGSNLAHRPLSWAFDLAAEPSSRPHSGAEYMFLLTLLGVVLFCALTTWPEGYLSKENSLLPSV